MTERGRQILRQALAPTPDCPPVEKLEAVIEGSAGAAISGHVETCLHCRAELEMLRAFLAPARDENEARAIHEIASRLNPPRVELPGAAPLRVPWWRQFMPSRLWVPALVTMAALVIAIGLEWNRGRPPELNPNNAGPEVMRSGAVQVIAPTGDVAEPPREVQWQPVPGATEYQVRMLEVDQSEMWRISTMESRVTIPETVRVKLAPAKTVIVRVRALDDANRVIGESEPVRFRVLQKVY